MSKIFGEFKSIEDLNKTAINLRKAGEKEEIIILGQENLIPEESINKFIDGEINYLVISEDEPAVEKLKKGLEESKTNTVPAEPIVNHLISKCEADNEFSNRVALKNKSIKDCFDYVYSEVRKKLNGVSGWVADEEVYKLAEDYFILDDVVIKDKAPERRIAPQKAEVKKTDIGKAEVKNNTKKEIKVKTKKEDVPSILQNKQVSLFDF